MYCRDACIYEPMNLLRRSVPLFLWHPRCVRRSGAYAAQVAGQAFTDLASTRPSRIHRRWHASWRRQVKLGSVSTIEPGGNFERASLRLRPRASRASPGPGPSSRRKRASLTGRLRPRASRASPGRAGPGPSRSAGPASGVDHRYKPEPAVHVPVSRRRLCFRGAPPSATRTVTVGRTAKSDSAKIESDFPVSSD
jgi:hypothetical protein